MVGDVQLQLGTKNKQSIFHVGEVITLQIAYSLAAGSRSAYVISNGSYDRGGRLGIESYHIEPSNGWNDPLKRYFQSFSSFIGGGLFSTSRLTTAPVIVSRDLNEWVRFDMPGMYRVSVTSTRVQPADHAFASTPLEVRSNEISLQIIPATPEWKRKRCMMLYRYLTRPLPDPEACKFRKLLIASKPWPNCDIWGRPAAPSRWLTG